MRTFAQKPKATQQTKSVKSTHPARALFSGQSRDVHFILQLQRTIGNQAVQRLLQSNAEELQAGSATTASTHFGHDFSRIPIFSPSPVQVQPKLTVSAPGDMYEQEADRVADQVMRMPEPQLQHGCPCGGGCPKCRKEQGGSEQLQTKHIKTNDAAATTVPPVQEVTRSSGEALDLPTRKFMESRFGHDFSQVRVHTGLDADEAARVVHARAFTLGHDIVLGSGQYTPNRARGRRLLAHELTHVVQQTGFSAGASRQIQRKETPKEEKNWLPELDEILPKRVGLLTHIFRVITLVDIFGAKPLEEHVRLIHSNAEAKKLSINHGVPGIVALYDTRTGKQLNVSAARQALTKSKTRYKRSSLMKLRLVPEQKAILSEKERAALAKKLKKQKEGLRKLKDALKANYDLADVVDGDAKWSIDHLRQVTKAFKLIPAGDKKALKGVVLKRVASLGGKTAGRFTVEQSVTDTTVTNKATLELANLAFKNGASESLIVHEVGHAVASMEKRTAAHAEHKAIAEENRLVGLSNTAVEKFNEAVEERNKTVKPLNDAVKEYNAARRSGDKGRIAATKKAYKVAKKAFDTKKAEEGRLKAIWKKADRKTRAAKKVAAQKAKATRKTKISSSDLRAIRNKSAADKKRHDSRLTAANKKASLLNEKEKAESSAYVSAIQEVSTAIKAFAEQTATQTLSEDNVETLVKSIQHKIKRRNTERGNLTTKNKENSALSTFIKVEQSQDAWFESAKAHSLAHNRSARVQRFVKIVDKKKIAPRTIFPQHSYAEKNWPHKPEEFYAEVYSMFLVKPNDLKAKSKTLYNWFKAKKYL